MGAIKKTAKEQKNFKRVVKACNEGGKDSAGASYKSCEDYARTVIWPDKFPAKKKKKSLKEQGITYGGKQTYSTKK